LPSRMILPLLSTTQMLEASKDTSIPTKCCAADYVAEAAIPP
jgi:hypothetical protein